MVVAGWDGDSNGHGTRILEGYLGILNAGTKFGETDGMSFLAKALEWLTRFHNLGPLKATSTASVVLTPGVRSFSLVIMRRNLKI